MHENYKRVPKPNDVTHTFDMESQRDHDALSAPDSDCFGQPGSDEPLHDDEHPGQSTGGGPTADISHTHDQGVQNRSVLVDGERVRNAHVPVPLDNVEGLGSAPGRASKDERPRYGRVQAAPGTHPKSEAGHLIGSTLISLLLVFGMLLLARWMLPPLVETVRYRWHRGELRAEYELAAEQLQRVSIDSLSDVSQLVSQRIGPSVVHIDLLRDDETRRKLEEILGGTGHPSFRYEGQGSGFIIDPSGYILTNHHVIDHARGIEVTLSDGRRFAAEVVAIDPPTDLAVIRISADGLLPVEWGDSDKLTVGTPVWAVGSPFGLQQTITFGIVSGKHRVDLSRTPGLRGIPAGSPYGDLIQSDVALNPGNSGGPLVNSLGQVVGVNAAILGDTFRGVSFSIPSNVARRVSALLIQEGEVPRGWLGVQLADSPLQSELPASGTQQLGVQIVGFPDRLPSPAREAGLMLGDVIVACDGKPVPDRATLIRMIGQILPGRTVSIEVHRPQENGFEQLEFQVVLGRRPQGL